MALEKIEYKADGKHANRMAHLLEERNGFLRLGVFNGRILRRLGERLKENPKTIVITFH